MDVYLRLFTLSLLSFQSSEGDRQTYKTSPATSFEASTLSQQVEQRFSSYVYYNVQDSSFQDQFSQGASYQIRSEPKWRIFGKWSRFRETEHYMIDAKRIENGLEVDPEIGTTQPVVKCEVLHDKTSYSYSYRDKSSFLNVYYDQRGALLLLGPYTWWSSGSLLETLNTPHPFTSVLNNFTRHQSFLADCEVRELDNVKNKFRFEVHYDPSMNYAPRLIRYLSHNKTNDTATIKQISVNSCTKLTDRSWIPTRWLLTQYSIQDFAKHYPDYNERTKFALPAENTAILYEATNTTELSFYPGFEDIGTITTITGAGRVFHFDEHNRRQKLTTDRIKSLIPVTHSDPFSNTLPTFDFEEVPQPRRAHTNLGFWAIIIAIVFIVVLLLAKRTSKKKLKLFLLFLPLLSLFGCSGNSENKARLGGYFDKPIVITEFGQLAKSDFYVVNEGDASIKITDFSGGCSCRKIDKSNLPITLGPKQKTSIPVVFSDGKPYENSSYIFTLDTSEGRFLIPAELRIIPYDFLSPKSISLLGLREMEADSVTERFDLTHRSVRRADEVYQALSVASSQSFRVEAASSVSTGVADPKLNLFYQDTTFHFVLTDRNVGVYSDEIIFLDEKHSVFAKVPITWKRESYVSTIPDKVLLGEHPVRIFLQCPDQRVEFLKVVSTPPAVEAIVVGQRELRVSLKQKSEAPTTKQLIKVAISDEKLNFIDIPVYVFVNN